MIDIVLNFVDIYNLAYITYIITNNQKQTAAIEFMNHTWFITPGKTITGIIDIKNTYMTNNNYDSIEQNIKNGKTLINKVSPYKQNNFNITINRQDKNIKIL